MRILSQDRIGNVNLPYEQVGVNMRKNEIIAYPIISLFEDDYWTMARYSTEAKAKRAMEMLHETYMAHVMYQTMSEQQRVLFVAGTSGKDQEKLYGVFQFPADDEVVSSGL